MMDDRELDELERLANAATAGPMRLRERGEDPHAGTAWAMTAEELAKIDTRPAFVTANLEFFAAARSAVPKLVSEIRRLRAILRDLAAIEPGDGGDGHREQCVLCGVYVVEWAKDEQGRETGLVPIDGHAHHRDSCPWRRAVEAVIP